MARLNSKNIISGLVGNLVFRNLDGKQIIQSRPNHVKQTKATKASSNEFSQCSSWTKSIRIGLHPFLVDLTDSYMYRRFNGQFYNALLSNTNMLKGQRNPLNANMSDLVGFEFNNHSLFAQYFLPTITTSTTAQHQITVTIPNFDPNTEMLFPDAVTNAELLVYIYATNFDGHSVVIDDYFVLPIDKKTPQLSPTTFNSIVLPEDYFVLVSAKLLYYTNNKFTVKNYCNNKALNPAMVVWANKI